MKSLFDHASRTLQFDFLNIVLGLGVFRHLHRDLVYRVKESGRRHFQFPIETQLIHVIAECLLMKRKTFNSLLRLNRFGRGISTSMKGFQFPIETQPEGSTALAVFYVSGGNFQFPIETQP